MGTTFSHHRIGRNLCAIDFRPLPLDQSWNRRAVSRNSYPLGLLVPCVSQGLRLDADFLDGVSQFRLTPFLGDGSPGVPSSDPGPAGEPSVAIAPGAWRRGGGGDRANRGQPKIVGFAAISNGSFGAVDA